MHLRECKFVLLKHVECRRMNFVGEFVIYKSTKFLFVYEIIGIIRKYHMGFILLCFGTILIEQYPNSSHNLVDDDRFSVENWMGHDSWLKIDQLCFDPVWGTNDFVRFRSHVWCNAHWKNHTFMHTQVVYWICEDGESPKHDICTWNEKLRLEVNV